MDIFERYFSARKRFIRWGDDRKRRKEAINIVFEENAFETIMLSIQQVQDNLSDHLNSHHGSVKPKKEEAPVVVEQAPQTYEDMEKRLEV